MLIDAQLKRQYRLTVAGRLPALGVPSAFVTGYRREDLPERYHSAPVLTKPLREDQLAKVPDALMKAGNPAPPGETDA